MLPLLKRKLQPLFNLQTLVILTLVLVILFQRCGSGKVVIPKPDTVKVTVCDTLYITKKDTVYGKPIPSAPPVIDTSWRDSIRLKDSSYEYLFGRYMELGDKYYSRHMFKQTFKIDSIGEATVLDTVVSNNIVGRSFSYNIKYPVVTETTTITIREPYVPKRQLYIGGTLWGNQNNLLNGANVGAIYKDRKDRMFGANVGVFNSQLTYGVSSYWKIKF